ncbi:MAG: hypothetical protein H6500_04275 [Candidatus Woesearchaeota archaeon]|nr:MAG: hypothetical protein H6500_04275 [Candidatus Woesearchaeota archaeon]
MTAVRPHIILPNPYGSNIQQTQVSQEDPYNVRITSNKKSQDPVFYLPKRPHQTNTSVLLSHSPNLEFYITTEKGERKISSSSPERKGAFVFFPVDSLEIRIKGGRRDKEGKLTLLPLYVPSDTFSYEAFLEQHLRVSEAETIKNLQKQLGQSLEETIAAHDKAMGRSMFAAGALAFGGLALGGVALANFYILGALNYFCIPAGLLCFGEAYSQGDDRQRLAASRFQYEKILKNLPPRVENEGKFMNEKTLVLA